MPIPSEDPIVNIPVVTPFDAQDRVDLDALSANVDRWQKTAAAGFLIGSQSGEELFLSEDEKLEMVRTISACRTEQQFVLGGIDCPSVTETLRRADAFANAGAEVLRIRFPRGGDAVVDAYFSELLPRCPLPVLLMHQCIPERFGEAGPPAAKPELLGDVCNRDNVFGYVTDHDVRFEARVKWRVTEDRRFWICNGSIILHGTLIGCNGTTTAFANIWPNALDKLLRLGMAGKYEEAMELQTAVQKIDAVMLPYLATGIKAAMQLLGFRGTRNRRPTPEMPPAEIARLKVVMTEAGLLE